MVITGVAIRHGIITVTGERPMRHHHLVRAVAEPEIWEQGFVTSEGEYVDRETAAKIALASGQVTKLNAPPDLYSEDLW